MAAGFGHNLFVGAGKEAVFGTAVARTKFFDVVSEGIAMSHTLVESGALGSPSIRSTRVAAGSLGFAGDLVFEVPYKGMEILFKSFFGNVASVPFIAPDDEAVVHTFNLAKALGSSLTLEVFRDTGTFAAPDTSFLYKGTRISQLAFEAAIDQFLRVTASVIAQDEDSAAARTPAPIAFSEGNLAVFTQGQVLYGGAAIEVPNFSISINQNLDDARRKLGSRLVRNIPRGDTRVEVTGTFSLDFDSLAQRNDFRNATEKVLKLLFTGGAIPATAKNEEIEILANLSRITDMGLNVDDPGALTQDITFKAYHGAGEAVADSEVLLKITNDVTAAAMAAL